MTTNTSLPTTEPCGTPYISATASDEPVCVLMTCVNADKYELNHFCTWSLALNRVEGISSSMQWSTVSNTALKSGSISSMYNVIVHNSNSSLDCLRLPVCQLMYRKKLKRLVWTVKWLAATLQINFVLGIRFEIGQNYIRSAGSSDFFNFGRAMASFSDDRKPTW